ncbi:hypothetical protein B0J18DRAFT_119551 [Chaetomium sp. MPI-SDFR-AT-0129]|nr:hypothetical protein B0J18DRAFT_119551 [Chaetomium sp. MPI-SDFR-AT-0129]
MASAMRWTSIHPRHATLVHSGPRGSMEEEPNPPTCSPSLSASVAAGRPPRMFVIPLTLGRERLPREPSWSTPQPPRRWPPSTAHPSHPSRWGVCFWTMACLPPAPGPPDQRTAGKGFAAWKGSPGEKAGLPGFLRCWSRTRRFSACPTCSGGPPDLHSPFPRSRGASSIRSASVLACLPLAQALRRNGWASPAGRISSPWLHRPVHAETSKQGQTNLSRLFRSVGLMTRTASKRQRHAEGERRSRLLFRQRRTAEITMGREGFCRSSRGGHLFPFFSTTLGRV